ncbi:hypothetical protein [Dyadobacter arcticus]|uniref:Uncharacterized protein n=1 Tax=Dyadobacter arcticus TaxID=1078754 RepID=A0ABX0UMT9_9BACT|nr:hypothetical protein [Dyadobacter arcticus]NIJ54319.1 hypothetical protein [Dyadobacter arcticus]
MVKYQKWFVGLIWILIITIVIVFWATAYRFSYNFPYYDDFQNIIQFVYKYLKADGIWMKLSLLFEQNFEHRVLFAKLLTLFQYYFTGQVNIQWLIILGNLSLLGILFLFCKYFFRNQLALISLFSITCLLFQVQHYEDTISWATCSLQHAPCIFFSLLSFHIALNRGNLFLGAGLVLMALFTSANGLSSILIWLVIVFFTTQDRRKMVIPSLILVTLTLVHLTTLTIHSGSLVEHATSNIPVKFILLLSFAGQVADVNMIGHIAPSVILGAIFLTPLLIVCLQVVRGKYPPITALQWFCAAGIVTLLFVAFLIVFARGVEPDFIGYKMDRYKIYAAFFAVLAIGFYDPYWSVPRIGALMRFVIAGSSLVFCVGSYYAYYGNIVNYRNTIEANEYNFLWSKTIYYPIIYQDPTTASYMDFAQKSFFHKPPEINDLAFAEISWGNIKDSVIIEKMETKSTITFANSEWGDETGKTEALYAVAVDQSTTQPKYLFSIENHYGRAYKQFYISFSKPISPGFSCVIYKRKLNKGAYDIYLVEIKKGQVARALKMQTIII